jgi:hypothetical protein
MTVFLPTEIRNNIVIINKVPWGFGRFRISPWECLSNKEKLMRVEEFSNLYSMLVKAGHQVVVYKVRKQRDWRKQFDEIVNQAPLETKESLQKTISAWQKYIEGYGLHEEYECIIAIQLDHQKNFIHFASDLTGIPYEKIFPYAADVLSDKTFDRLQNDFFNRVSGYKIEPLTAEEVVEFYRDFNYQGMPKPPIDETVYQKWPWDTADFTWLMPNPYEDEDKYIRIDGEREARYVAFYAVSLLPGKIITPGFDLFEGIESLGIPVNAQFRCQIVDPRMTRMFVDRKRKATKQNHQHNWEAGVESADDYETQSSAEKMLMESKRSRGISNTAQIFFSVAARDPEELDYYCSQLQDYFEQKGVTAKRVIADQMEMYENWLPSNRWSVMGYKLKLFPDRSAAITLPGASELVGDKWGLPKGIMHRNGRLFRLFLPAGNINNTASVAVIVGPTGSGKTHLAYDMIRDMLLTIPARGIAMDPKNEKKGIAKHFPGYDNVQEITVDGTEYPGVFDPLIILKRDIERAKEKAIAIIQKATNFYDVATENIIVRAVDEVGFKYQAAPSSYEPSMIKVIEELKAMENEKAADIAFKLERISRLSHGKLIFGDPNMPGAKKIQMPRTGFIVIRIAGLNLPDKGQEAVDLDQRVSQAVNIGKNLLCYEFLMQGKDTGIFSFLYSDECYHDFEMEETRKDYEHITRQGRSNYCGIIFATQNPSDIPRSILNNTGTYICLGTKQREETEIALRELKIDPKNEALAEELERLGSLQSKENLEHYDGMMVERSYSLGYVRDIYDRTGLVRFVTPEEEVRRFLNTNPVVKAQQAMSVDSMDEPEEKEYEVV